MTGRTQSSYAEFLQQFQADTGTLRELRPGDQVAVVLHTWEPGRGAEAKYIPAVVRAIKDRAYTVTWEWRGSEERKVFRREQLYPPHMAGRKAAS